MPRQTLDRELHRLQDEVLALGSMVENALTDSVQQLKERDLEASRLLVAQDREINNKRYEIEQDALALFATQQPMARDLRALAAILEIVTELERIGDYAKGIARINVMIGEGPLMKPLIDLPEMAERARSMLHRALEAFVQRDVDAARAIAEEDDEVDALYNRVYRELLVHVIADHEVIDQSNYLLWAAHNLERAADRVINLCERVIFTVTGEIMEMDVEQSGVESI